MTRLSCLAAVLASLAFSAAASAQDVPAAAPRR